MLLLDITVVNVALPSIREDLGASFTDLQWVVDAYALTLAALVLTAGSLADRLGRRRVFAAGLAIFSARLAALRAVARPDLPQPLPRAAGRRRRGDVRGLAGAGRAGVPRGPRARHRDGHLRRDDRRRGRDRAAGRRRAHRRARLAVDLLSQRADRPGGDRASPTRSCARAATRTRPAIDWAGVATFSAALFMLVLALVRGNDEGWGSTLIVSLLAGAAALLGGLRRHREPRAASRCCRSGSSGGLVHRRPAGGLRGLGLGVRAVPLPDPLPAELPRLLAPSRPGCATCRSRWSASSSRRSPGALLSRVPARVLMSVGLALAGVGLLLMSGVRRRLGVDDAARRLPRPRRRASACSTR